MSATHIRHRFLEGVVPYLDLAYRITLHNIVHVLVLCLFQISVQMTKVLLHMEDKYSINSFLSLRQATMVALTVTDSIPVCSVTSVIISHQRFTLITTQLYHHSLLLCLA